MILSYLCLSELVINKCLVLELVIEFLKNTGGKVFLGCLQTVSFTDFLAEMVFWELSFFIRNDSKLAFLEKNPLKHALFTLQHYPSS